MSEGLRTCLSIIGGIVIVIVIFVITWTVLDSLMERRVSRQERLARAEAQMYVCGRLQCSDLTIYPYFRGCTVGVKEGEDNLLHCFRETTKHYCPEMVEEE